LAHRDDAVVKRPFSVYSALDSVSRIVRFEAEDGSVRLGEQPEATGAPAEVLEGDLFGGLQRTGSAMAVRSLLSPLVPPDIYCVLLNYREVIKKSGAPPPERPAIFMKASSALAHPEQDIWRPRIEFGEQLDWEAELVMVIGKTCRNVSKDKALDYVLGYTAGNDVSSRYWQKNAGAGQFLKGKSFDTFCPLGPVLVTPEVILDPQALRVQTRINGETMQDFSTSDMLFSCAEIIEWLSHGTTLLPGTVIMTGSGPGVGQTRSPPLWMKPGDVVEVEVEKIGVLRNRIAEPPLVQ